MTLTAFQKWLDSYLNFEKTQEKNIFWLDSMRFLCEKLENPQKKIPCIHVAGSKGKGSVSAMIASAIEAAGYSCGVYASPHITDFRERVRTAHSFFEDEIYEKSADELVSCVDSLSVSELPGGRALTWFELVTVFAFLCFRNACCDYVVYEVGLGGRLDSTNVIVPLVSVLTPIELEHTEFLGDTISKIAAEKAGIIKDGVPVVVSHQNYKDAETVFRAAALEHGSAIQFADEASSDCRTEFVEARTECTTAVPEPQEKQNAPCLRMRTTFCLFGTERWSLLLRLFGTVQAQNAVTAVLALKTAIPALPKSAVEKGVSRAFLPGRFELHSAPNGATVVFDGAHTVRSIQNTVTTIKELFPDKRISLLFACAGDKDAADIVPLFKGAFSRIVLPKPRTVRKANPRALSLLFSQSGMTCEVIENVSEAVQGLICHAQNDDILLVTGSFYLVSEAKGIL